MYIVYSTINLYIYLSIYLSICLGDKRKAVKCINNMSKVCGDYLILSFPLFLYITLNSWKPVLQLKYSLNVSLFLLIQTIMYNMYNNVYLILRFGLANSINTYLWLRILVGRGIFSLKCVSIYLPCQIWV